VSDLQDGLNEMAKAEPGYGKAVAYSDGPVTEVFASRRIRRLLRDKGISFQTVLGDVVIDAVADKLRIESITADSDARTKMLADVDEDNKMALLRPAVMRRALQLGDSYLMPWPVMDEDGEPVPGKVRISVHDARNMRVIYDDEEPEQPKFAIQKWQIDTTEGKRVRIDLLYKDKLRHFISKTAKGERAADFMPYEADGREAEEDNPYGQLPVFHFHGTGLPGEYGKPEHRSFYGTQDKLIKLTSSDMAGVDFAFLPQRVALREAGAKASSPAELDEDEFLSSPDGQRTKTRDGQQVSTLSSEPGSIWDLIGYKDVKQLDPADPDVILKRRAEYLREGAVASKTPLHLFDRTGQIPSGVALTTANEPLDNKSTSRRTFFDSTWRAFYAFVLKILGEPGAVVTIAWAPIESTDETTKLAQAKQKQEIGVEFVQTLTELGYKAEDVKRWLEDGDGGLPQKVALLAQLGQAVSAFSTAVSSGVMDGSVVQQVIGKVMGDIDDQSPAPA